LNLEMACVPEIVDLACQWRPHQVTLVPERREEVTTEGGLDALATRRALAQIVPRLRGCNIAVSLFLDADARQVDVAAEVGAQAVARIEGMRELNIGHSIVSRAILVGMQAAVREMKNLLL
jgi:pyridoxine 5-phosphate synthase